MPELTRAQLQKAATDMGRDIARGAEAIRGHAKAIDDEAQDTARVGELIGAMKVDSATVGETNELSRIMAGLSEAAIAYAFAGDTTAKLALAVRDQNTASHGGIQEAVDRSGVTGIHDVDRTWLTRE